MIDQILRQRYHIIKRLGEGGMGETFLAEDLDIPIMPKPWCVVKRLQPRENESDLNTIRRLFEQEAQILYRLGHQYSNIPQLYAYFQEDENFYLIQEYIEGEELSQELIPDQPWTETQTIDFLKEILAILAYVHQNQVIHRDLKPQNIMRRTKDGKLCLIDFGSVKEVSTLSAPKTVIIGTPGYMPMEQALGKPQFSSDIYAVGIIAIQGITGQIIEAFPEDEKEQTRWKKQLKISDSLAIILSKMVHDDFRKRYDNATLALKEINQIDTLNKSINSSYKITQSDENLALKPIINPAPTQLSSSVEGVTEETPISPISWVKKLLNPLKKSPPNQLDLTKNEPTSSEKPSVIPPPQSDSQELGSTAPYTPEIQRFPRKIHQKWGYLDQEQKVVIIPQFDEAKAFSEGLARVRIGNKWGYIDLSGNWVMSPRFDAAENFQNGLAKITLGDKSGYINPQGKVVKAASSSSQQKTLLFPKKMNNQYGFVDVNGKWIISPKYADAGAFSEGLAPVKIGNKYGYINPLGEIVIPPQFDLAVNFQNGYARVMINNQFYRINLQGKVIS